MVFLRRGEGRIRFTGADLSRKRCGNAWESHSGPPTKRASQASSCDSRKHAAQALQQLRERDGDPADDDQERWLRSGAEGQLGGSEIGYWPEASEEAVVDGSERS